MRGKLITVEGIDGSGKSTLCAGLSEHFADRLVALREPGGVGLSEQIRVLVKDPELEISAQAEALLFAAARAQLVSEKLRPLLDSGRSVLLDRFVDSSLAYQGAGRGLGIAAVQAINELATAGLTPDLTLLIRVTPELAAQRMSEDDRLERAGSDFFADVTQAYDRLAAAESGRFVVLDGALPKQEILAAAVKVVSGAL
ncbi:MAG TPA: dTMP kinase [Baekduia sp.]|nr:dTMP kinase [Baekduia sp.]